MYKEASQDNIKKTFSNAKNELSNSVSASGANMLEDPLDTTFEAI